MVTFSNIKFDSEWVYADAYDHDYRANGKIKVHRIREEFFTDCEAENCFKKAAWSLIREVNNRKIKQNGNKSIAWG